MDWRAVASAVEHYHHGPHPKDANVAATVLVCAIARHAKVQLHDSDPTPLKQRSHFMVVGAEYFAGKAHGKIRLPKNVLEPVRAAVNLHLPDTIDTLDVDWFQVGQLAFAAATDAASRPDRHSRLDKLKNIIDHLLADAGHHTKATALKRACAHLLDEDDREELGDPG